MCIGKNWRKNSNSEQCQSTTTKAYNTCTHKRIELSSCVINCLYEEKTSRLIWKISIYIHE